MVGKGSRRSDTKQEPLVSHGFDVATVHKKWKWHEGAWYYDLWVHAEKRLVLSSMESARVLSLQESASGSSGRDRERKKHIPLYLLM